MTTTIDALKALRETMPQNNNNTKQENEVDSPAPKANKVTVEEVAEQLSYYADYLKTLAENNDDYSFFREIETIGERIWDMFHPEWE